VRASRRGGQTGQALVETAMVIPLLLLLAFGVVGVGRVIQAQLGVSAVSREAARAATLASTPNEALTRASGRGQEVARDLGLTNGSLQFTVDLGAFERGGQVQSAAHYTVSLGDLPFLSGLSIPVESHHVERIDLYQSRWP
jgi:Flp pilus assembly protein TadG